MRESVSAKIVKTRQNSSRQWLPDLNPAEQILSADVERGGQERAQRRDDHLAAVGETVILLHPHCTSLSRPHVLKCGWRGGFSRMPELSPMARTTVVKVALSINTTCSKAVRPRGKAAQNTRTRKMTATGGERQCKHEERHCLCASPAPRQRSPSQRFQGRRALKHHLGNAIWETPFAPVSAKS